MCSLRAFQLGIRAALSECVCRFENRSCSSETMRTRHRRRLHLRMKTRRGPGVMSSLSLINTIRSREVSDQIQIYLAAGHWTMYTEGGASHGETEATEVE